MTTKRLGKYDITAGQMRARIAAREQASTEQDCCDGLQITLSRTGPAYRLTIGREGAAPSAHELAVLSAAFDVPDGTIPVHTQVVRINPKTNRTYKLDAFILCWQELEPVAPLTQRKD